MWLKLALSTALEREGKIDDAIAQLAEDTRPTVVAFYSGWPWQQCRVKLAELYRKAGRLADAAKVEDEIRLYLSEGDADHPVLVALLGRSK